MRTYRNTIALCLIAGFSVADASVADDTKKPTTNLVQLTSVTTIGPTKFQITADDAGVLVYTVHRHLIHHRIPTSERKKIAEVPCFGNCVATTLRGLILYTQSGSESGELYASTVESHRKLADLPRFAGVKPANTQHELLVCDGSDVVYIHSHANRTNGEPASALSSVDTSIEPQLRTHFYSAQGAITSMRCGSAPSELYFATSVRTPSLELSRETKVESIHFVNSADKTAAPLLIFEETVNSTNGFIKGVGGFTDGPFAILRSPSWIENQFNTLNAIAKPDQAPLATFNGNRNLSLISAFPGGVILSDRDETSLKTSLIAASSTGEVNSLTQSDHQYVDGTLSVTPAHSSLSEPRVAFKESGLAGPRLVWSNANGSQRKSRALTDGTQEAKLSRNGKCLVAQSHTQISSIDWNTEVSSDLVKHETSELKIANMAVSHASKYVVISATTGATNRHLVYWLPLPDCATQ